MECFIKVHSRPPDSVVIGVCDKELIGKKLRENNRYFHVSEGFFKDKLMPIEKAIELLKNCPNFNAVGENVINAMIEKKMIHPEGILRIENVPIAIRILM